MTVIDDLIPGVTVYIRPIKESGSVTARTLVRDILGVDTGHYPDGAPFAVGRDDVVISISHGAGRAVLAVAPAGTAVGVDIESDRREHQLRRVADRFVSPDDDSSLSLLHLWTAKEALYKAIRQPATPLTAIRVDTSSAVWLPLPDALLCLCKK